MGLPGHVYALVGIYSVAACLAGGLLMGLVAATYAECASRLPGTGGSVLYAGAAFGPAFGFAAGWLAIVSRLLSYASITNLAIGYAAGVLPALSQPGWRVFAISMLSLVLGGVVGSGAALSARTNAGFTLAKLALLAGFVLAGLAVPWPPHRLVPPPLPSAGACSQAVVLLLFGLIGMDAAVVNGGEVRDPRRTVPFGLGTGMLAVVGLYAAILLVCGGVVPDLARSQRPVFDGAVAIAGAGAGLAAAAGAVLVMTGTLFTTLFVGPRLVFALALSGQLPAGLARVQPRTGTPLRAVVLHTAAAWALAVGSTFLGALTATTLTRLMLYALTAAALPVLRRRGVSEHPDPLRLPGGAWMAGAAIVLCVWLMTQCDYAAWVSTLGCLGLGGLVWAAAARR